VFNGHKLGRCRAGRALKNTLCQTFFTCFPERSCEGLRASGSLEQTQERRE
jgi:hypothetical protein